MRQPPPVPTPPASTPAARRDHRLVWHGAVLAGALGLTLIAWWPAHDAWFLLDDYRWLMPPAGPWEIFRWFTGTWGHGYAYRPLTRVSFLFDLHLFGWQPAGWHLHSYLLHAVNVWLLFALLWTVTRRRAAALAVAALFAASPMSHENVAWISGRTFLLGGCFFLVSLNLLARAFQSTDSRRGARLVAGGVLAFAAGLGSYEPVIVLPLIVLLTAICFPSVASPSDPLVRRALAWMFGLLPIFIIGRLLVMQGHFGETTEMSPYWFYAPLRFYWRAYVAPAWTPRVVTPILLAAAAIATLLLSRYRASLVPGGLRLQAYLVLLALTLFLPFANVLGFADRFFYLLQIAFIGVVVLLGCAVARVSRAGAAIATAALVVLVTAGVADSRQAAAEWASAARINQTIADGLYARVPAWPNGTDVAIGGVPTQVGRGPTYVLYDRESVLQHYLYESDGSSARRFDPRRVDAHVYLAQRLTPSERAAIGQTRPARYFEFDPRAETLTEVDRAAWMQMHGAVAAR